MRACILAAGGASAAPAATHGAADRLAAHLAALQGVRTLSAHFTCEKRLKLLETPLESSGEIWIEKARGSGAPSVRFSTDQPYVSELILTNGKVFARSEHESEWTKTDQSSRPGLTAVMQQLGGWSMGEAAGISEMYTVEAAPADARIPAMPAEPGGGGAPATEAEAALPAASRADMFILAPKNKDLAVAVKQVTLAIDRTTHHLRFLEVETRQGDVTRYWFHDVKTDVPLPAEVFQPRGLTVSDAP